MALELIHGKNFKDTAARIHISPTTVMKKFDDINEDMLKEPIEIKRRLYQFYELVVTSGITEFQKEITIFKHWEKIWGSFAFGFHNGYIEGINNQTKVIKRNAFDRIS